MSVSLLHACRVGQVANMTIWQLLPGCIQSVWHDKLYNHTANAVLRERAMLERCQDEVSQRLCIGPFCRACQKRAKHS